MASDLVSTDALRALVWCEPGAWVAEEDGTRGIVYQRCSPSFVHPRGSVRLMTPDHFVTIPIERLSVPLGVSSNLLGVLRASLRRFTGKEAPALVILCRGRDLVWEIMCAEGICARFGAGEIRPTLIPTCRIDALEGVTAPSEAARIITEHVLGVIE